MQIDRTHLLNLLAQKNFESAKTYIQSQLQRNAVSKSAPEFTNVADLNHTPEGKILKLATRDEISIRLSIKKSIWWILIMLAMVGYTILSYYLHQQDWLTILIGGIGALGFVLFCWKLFDRGAKLFLTKTALTFNGPARQSISNDHILIAYLHKRVRKTTYAHPDDHLIIFSKLTAEWYEWPVFDLELTPEEICWLIGQRLYKPDGNR